MDDQSLTQRAFRAYFRAAGAYADQPSAYSSGIERSRNGRDYVVLRGGRSAAGICAIYSIRKGEKLRSISRWPADLVG